MDIMLDFFKIMAKTHFPHKLKPGKRKSHQKIKTCVWHELSQLFTLFFSF